jgi:hypothetical protein
MRFSKSCGGAFENLSLDISYYRTSAPRFDNLDPVLFTGLGFLLRVSTELQTSPNQTTGMIIYQ